MKHYTLYIIVLFTILSCSKIPTMKQEIVNIVDAKELGFFKEESDMRNKTIQADYFYKNGSLYLSDQKNNRIIGIDEDNEVFLEIGNLMDSSYKQDENFWEKELQKYIASADSSEEITKRKKTKTQQRQKVRVQYGFKNIDKVAVDLKDNIYVVHKNETGVEILKFDANGNFLYRMGEEGRDNASFSLDTVIILIEIAEDNGIWVKYLDKGKLKVKYFMEVGKATPGFEQNQIEQTILAFLEKKENLIYSIEDIFPLAKTNRLAVVVNAYTKEGEIEKKLFFQINRQYNVENYWEFDDKRLQVFRVNMQNHLLCFSYLTKEKMPLLKVYDNKGDMILERKIALQRFNYKRIYASLTQEGEILGVFLKKNLLYFVVWK